MTKVCARCREKKAHSEFRRAHNRLDGLYNYCKPCQDEASRISYCKHRKARLACARAYAARPENAARLREYNKRYYAAHRNEQLAAAKRWRVQNLDKRRAYVRRWNKENRECVRAFQRRYKARKRGATYARFTAADWRIILLTFDARCAYCGRRAGVLEQDHVIPLSRGGAHSRENIVPACRSCNAKKSDNPAPSFWRVNERTAA